MKINMPKKEMVKITMNMATPAILEAFFVALAGLVDSYMVSSLGSEAVAAVGLTTQPKFLGLAVFMAANVSVSALVARRVGEGKRRDANVIAMTAILFVILGSILLSAFFLGIADPLIRFCGSSPDTHAMAVEYYRIIMAGMIFNTLQMVINAAQRGSGNTKITARTNLVSNAVNVVMNYLLIGGHFGFPALGIRGAAIATVLGTVVACVMSILSIRTDKTYVSIPLMIAEKVRPSLQAFMSIVKIGYGIFFEQMLMRVGFMLTALMAADQGTYAMAAHQVASNLMGLSFSFGDGLQAAAVALIGRSLGEGSPEKAKEYGSTCRFMGGLMSMGVALVYLLGGRALFAAFFDEPEIVEVGVHLSYVVIFIVVFQISQVVYMGSLRGAGDTLFTAVVSMFSVTIVRTIISFVLGYPLGLGIVGIWCGVLADQASRCLLGGWRFKQGKWVNIKI